jgi:hypothetical protein
MAQITLTEWNIAEAIGLQYVKETHNEKYESESIEHSFRLGNKTFYVRWEDFCEEYYNNGFDGKEAAKSVAAEKVLAKLAELIEERL